MVRKIEIVFLNNIKKTKEFINLCKLKKIENFIFLSSSNVLKKKKFFLKTIKLSQKIIMEKIKLLLKIF